MSRGVSGDKTRFPDYSKLKLSDEYLCAEELEIIIELPYPIHRPFKVSDLEDSIEKYYQTIKQNQIKIRKARNSDLRAQSTIFKQNYKSSTALISSNVFNLCKDDVKEIVQSDYNLHYTTGILDYFMINEVNYLIRPDQNNSLLYNRLHSPKKVLTLNLKEELTEKVQGLQAQLVRKLGVLFLVVHNKEVKILKIEAIDDTAICIWRKSFKESIIFAKLDEFGRLGVILSNKTFYLYDYNNNFKWDLETSLTANVITFEFDGENGIILVHPHGIDLFSLDTFETKLINIVLKSCDYLTACRLHNGVIYAVSRHFLFRIDAHNTDKFEFCAHLMKASPCYMQIVDFHANCVLALSSQKNSETVVFTGRAEVDSLPRAAPSVAAALEKCQISKDVLLTPNLDERIVRSCAGIKLFADTDALNVFLVNDLGEIYRQKVFTPDLYFEDGNGLAVDAMFKFINRLPIFEPVLHVTNLAEVGKFRFVFNKPVLKSSTNQNNLSRVRNFLKLYEEKYKKKNLSSLAENFADIWEDEEDERFDAVPVPVDAHDKVYSWIKSTSFGSPDGQ